MTQRTLLFASWHFYLDQSNGASVSTRLLLRALADRGWKVRTLCSFICDDHNRDSVPDYLTKRGLHVLRQRQKAGDPPFTAYSFRDGRVESLLFCPEDRTHVPSTGVGNNYLMFYSRVLDKLQPDVVATYGGYWFAPRMPEEAKRRGAKTAVFLHNFAYDNLEYFRSADLVFTPSSYASEHYRTALGIDSVSIPPIMDWNSVLPSADAPVPNEEKYVLYVNPSPQKGAYLFAAIAAEMQRIRPDIRFVVVEGSAGAPNLLNTGVDWSKVKNVRFMKNTPLPKSFYSLARITIIPSFFRESFCRVAAESMAAGIPVIASDRGALTETVGDAGVLLSIPEQYSPETRVLPTAAAVAPWTDAIQKLWDDQERYARLREKGLERARLLWDFETIINQYELALNGLINNGNAQN